MFYFFLPRSMVADTIFSDFEPKKINSVTVSIVSPSICHEVIGPDAMIFIFWLLSFKPASSLLHSLVCYIFRFHIQIILQSICLSLSLIWLILLRKIPHKSIHIVANRKFSSFFCDCVISHCVCMCVCVCVCVHAAVYTTLLIYSFICWWAFGLLSYLG